MSCRLQESVRKSAGCVPCTGRTGLKIATLAGAFLVLLSSAAINTAFSQQSSFTWNADGTTNQRIRMDPNAVSYDTLYATFSHQGISTDFSYTEKVGDSMATELPFASASDPISAWTHFEYEDDSIWDPNPHPGQFRVYYGFGNDSNYGIWWRTAESGCLEALNATFRCMYFRFEPNKDVIDNLPQHTTVISTFGVTDSLKVQVEIRRDRITIKDVSASEADGMLTFTVDAESAQSKAFTVDWAAMASTAGDTLATAADFVQQQGASPAVFSRGTVTFALDQTSMMTEDEMTVQVTSILDDSIVEGDETFEVTLSNLSITSVATDEAFELLSDTKKEGKIKSDDKAQVSIANEGGEEGSGTNGEVEFTVTSTDRLSSGFKVAYVVTIESGDTAVESDFDETFPLMGEVDFTPDMTDGLTDLSETFTIDLLADAVPEPDETFTVTLTGVSGDAFESGLVELSTTPANRVAKGTILNDDGVELSIANAEGDEGTGSNGSVTFTVSANDNLSAAYAVEYEVTIASGDTAMEADFDETFPLRGTVNFMPGGTENVTALSETFTINFAADAVPESDETFTVTLTNVTGAAVASGPVVLGATAEDKTAKGTILNDDGVELSIANAEGDEGTGSNGSVTFTVSANDNLPAAYAVTYEVTIASGDTAMEADFEDAFPLRGTVDFMTDGTANVTALSETFTIDFAADAVPEPDETFTVTLTNVTGAAVASGPVVLGATAADKTAKGTILNDDGVVLSIANAEGDEGTGTNGSVVFTISANDNLSEAFTVAWKADIESGDSAVAGDFVGTPPLTGMVEFDLEGTENITALRKTFPVPLKEDSDPEENKTFTVTLTGVTGDAADSGDVSVASDPGNKAKGTIRNDDGVVLSVADSSGNEGTGSNGSVVFTVSATGKVNEAFTVSWRASIENGDTAVAGDFVGTPPLTGTVEFELESSDNMTARFKTFPVPLMHDPDPEEDKTFTLTLTGVTGDAATSGKVRVSTDIDKKTATGTVSNDDGVLVSVEDSFGNEGTGTNGSVVFTISTNDNLTEAFTVAWRASIETGDTAVAADFVGTPPLTGMVEFDLEGTERMTARSKTFSVPLKEDSDPEEDKTFTVTLTGVTGDAANSGNVSVAPDPDNTARGRIDNDDGVLVSVADASGDEGTGTNGSVVFTISANDNLSESFTVAWRATLESGDTAVAGDFVGTLPLTGMVEFDLEGSEMVTARSKTFPVPVMENAVPEGNKTFTVTLTGVTGDAADSGDVAVAADPGNKAKGMIINDDGLQLSVANSSGIEGTGTQLTGTDGSVVFTVSAGGMLNEPFTVSWQARVDSGNTAVEADFVGTLPLTGTVEFPLEGQDNMTAPSKTFPVPVMTDAFPEEDETFTVELTGVSGVAADSGNVSISRVAAEKTATGTIDNDDGVVVSVADASGDEGTGSQGSVVFTISANDTLSEAFTVAWSASVESGDSAVAGDFVGALPLTGTVEFELEGTDMITARSKTFPVPVAGDSDSEEDETFTVELTGVTGDAANSGDVAVAPSPGNKAKGRIDNDDGVVVSVADASGDEGTGINGSVVFTISANDTLSEAFTVSWQASIGSGDSAADGDFISTLPLTGMVEFDLEGNDSMTARTRTFPVPVKANSDPGEDKTFTVELTGVSGDAVDSGDVSVAPAPGNMATGTIEDDDGPVVEEVSIVAMDPNTVIEGEATEVNFEISSKNGSAGTVVRYTVSQSGSFIFSDVGNSKVLTGETTPLSIPIIDNLVVDVGGSVTVTLQENSSEGYAIGIRSAVVNITDNDSAAATAGYTVAGLVIVDLLTEDTDEEQKSDTDVPLLELPSVSLIAATNSIEEGDTAVFKLIPSFPTEHELTVAVSLTDNGNFISGSSTRTANIGAGGIAGILEVGTVDDSIAENDGSITAAVAEGYGYAIGSESSATVIVTDAGDRESRRLHMAESSGVVLSNVMGAISARSLDAVAQRVTSAFSNGGGAKWKLGGNATVQDFVRAGGDLINGEGMDSWQEALDETSFEFGLFPEEGAANQATVWGFGDFRDMTADVAGAGKLNGDLFTGNIGMDALIGDGMVAGLTSTVSRSRTDFTSAGNESLGFASNTTGLHPYIGLASPNGSRFQVISGFGLGEVELDQEGYETEFLSSSYASIGASGNSLLYSSSNPLLAGTSNLALEGRFWMGSQFISSESDAIGNLRADARHLRIATVVTQDRKLESGVTVSPSVSMGLREDGMQGESFLGMEAKGGINLGSPHGYGISTEGEILFAGTERIQEWGMSGHLFFDTGNDGLGIQVNVVPEWGWETPAAKNALWGDSVLVNDFDSGMGMNGAQVNAEIGYGLTAWEDMALLKPYSGVLLSQTLEDKYRAGSKLKIGSDMELGFESSRTFKDHGIEVNEFNLEGSIRW